MENDEYFSGYSDNMASSDENLPTSDEDNDSMNKDDLKLNITKIDPGLIKSVEQGKFMIRGNIYKSSGIFQKVAINGINVKVLNDYGLIQSKGMQRNRMEEILLYNANDDIQNEGVVNSVKGYNDEKLKLRLKKMIGDVRENVYKLAMYTRKGKSAKYDIVAENSLAHIKIHPRSGHIKDRLNLPQWIFSRLAKKIKDFCARQIYYKGQCCGLIIITPRCSIIAIDNAIACHLSNS